MKLDNLIKTLSVAALLGFVQTSFAATLSPEEALTRAMSQIRRNAPSATAKLNLVYTEKRNLTEEPALYVFSRPGSYYIVSADDKAEALLGYADESFDAAAMPPAMKWWLGEYARQIEATQAPGRAPLRAERKAIEPMIKTLWDQGTPYNDKCPLDNGVRSVTGCAATAMAMVMKYFNYPEKGTGTKAYRNNDKLISLNFASITFDWANMLDRYTSAASEIETNAVANLMYACGVSIEMQYSSYMSGATDMIVPNALVNYFKYDKGVRYFMRDYYTTAQWEDLVYNQLATCGPVQYSGQSNEGGHSFVCDGYSSDGYFHINWGWSGMSDGYFLLTALEPEQQGIGGSQSGFTYMQSVVGEVRLPQANSTTYPELYIIENFSIPTTSFRIGSTINVYAKVANYSYATTSAALGLKFVNQETGATSYAIASSGVQLRQGYMVDGYTLTMPLKAAGTYTVTPAMRTSDGDYYDIPVKKAFSNSYTFKISSGNVTATPNTPGSLKAEDLNLKTKVYLNQDFNLTATISNPSSEDLYATIAPALLSDKDEVLAVGEYYFVNLKAGESTNMNYVGYFANISSSWTPVAGTYKMCVINTQTNVPISDSLEVAVNKAVSPALSVSAFNIEGGTTAVDAGNVKFGGTVRCRMGYFGGSLDIVVFPADDDNAVSIAAFPTEHIFIGLGQNATFSAGGRLTGVEIGKTYIAGVYNGMNPIADYLNFTIGSDTGGIDDVTPASDIIIPSHTTGTVHFGAEAATVNVYSMTGTLVCRAHNAEVIDISHVGSGIYLIELTTEGSLPQRKVQRIVKH